MAMQENNIFDDLRNSNKAAAKSSVVGTERQKARLFINVGLVREPDAEGNYGFLSTPFGMPLDTMTRADENVRNPKLRRFRQEQNMFLDHLIKMAESIPQGEGRTIAIEVQLFHSTDYEELAASEGPIEKASDISAIDFKV